MTTDPGPSPPAVTIASSPFDRPDGDVVLLSADHVKFACHKATLSIASPLFADMFSLPQAPQAAGQRSSDGSLEADGTPIVPVSESSKVLETFLRLIYPVDTPALDDPEHNVEVLCASRKYQISEARPGLVLLIQAIHAYTLSHPLQAFALSCLYLMEDEALLAAKNILNHPGLKKDVLNASALSNSPAEPDPYLARFLDEGLAGQFVRLRKYLKKDGQVNEPYGFVLTTDYQTRGPTELVNGLSHEHWHSYYHKDLGRDLDDSIFNLLQQFPNVDKESARAVKPKKPQKGLNKTSYLFEHVPPDIHIRSSAYTSSDHLVHKLILLVSSPILGELANESTEIHEDGLPVLWVPENEEVLRHLLHYSYGFTNSIVDPTSRMIDTLLFLDVAQAAKKYSMTDLIRNLKVILGTYAISDSIQAYYVAAACGWKMLTTSAARNSLALQAYNEAVYEEYVPILEHIPVRAYVAFMRYHITCSAAQRRAVKTVYPTFQPSASNSNSCRPFLKYSPRTLHIPPNTPSTHEKVSMTAVEVELVRLQDMFNEFQLETQLTSFTTSTTSEEPHNGFDIGRLRRESAAVIRRESYALDGVVEDELRKVTFLL
ncbi:hypothetical protein EIP91_006659 [Steccherinum ochraceum]|uniref:BTB domain-containing protein n=1 Tax=Steccherinum ochraceum TaxID=92696 RepID=A0A4R0RB50_9APHY|nr:hypothetical protein EIP91_006659 [Steccherinum ochraceum]